MATIHSITMPQWGLEMTEGLLSEWHFRVGEQVSKGAPLAEIETAKIVNTLESNVQGTLRRLVGRVGETLPVGALLAVVAQGDVSEDEVETFVQRVQGEGPPAAATQPVPQAGAAPAAAPQVVEPSVQEPTAAGELLAQNAAVSAAVRSGPECATDVYATPIARRVANRLGVELRAVHGSGRRARILAIDVEAAAQAQGISHPRRAVVAPVTDAKVRERRNAAAYASPIARRFANRHRVDLAIVRGTGRNGRISLADVAAVYDIEAIHGNTAAANTNAGNGVRLTGRAGPAARRLAAELGVELATSTGRSRNVILKDDIRKVAATPSPQARPTSDASELVPFTPMRKVIAANLLRSKQTIPHFYLTMDAQVDRLLALRQEMNGERGAHKLSINDFLLRATALALSDVPDANVHYTDEGLRKFKAVHLCVAVAVDGGLMTPVVHDAQEKTVSAISEEARALAECARNRTLKPEQFTGGTFTVSNLGMYGIRQFEAIINPPQGGILAIGQVRRDAFEEQGGFAFRSVMSLTLSCDHRAIDGAVGARFLSALKRRIEGPMSLLS